MGEKEVLESVEEGLVESVFPPGCNLDCFFDNNPWLEEKIDHTEKAVLDFLQNKTIPIYICACQAGAPVEEDSAPDASAVEAGAMKEIVHVQEEIDKLENQEGDGAKL